VQRVKGAGGMAQVAECLSSKHKALSSNPSTDPQNPYVLPPWSLQ
jgi:hypothetical protein